MPDDYLENQTERRVPSTPTFNGATCLICLNVPRIGLTVDAAYAVRVRADPNAAPPSNQELDDAILAAFDLELANCPAGQPVKLQFLYHYSGGTVENTGATKRSWSQRDSVRRVLERIAQRSAPRVAKVYVTACISHEHKDVVNAAFSISTVTHVVTVNTTIYLTCAQMAGGGWDSELHQPTFKEIPIKVIVWEKENGRQVANIPDAEIPADHRFNLHTNAAELRSAPPTGPCPTTAQITGSGDRTSRYYNTRGGAVAAAAGTASAGAGVDASLARNAYSCPNPQCRQKTLQNLRVTVTSSGSSFAWVRWVFDLFRSRRYVCEVAYTWAADVVCSP